MDSCREAVTRTWTWTRTPGRRAVTRTRTWTREGCDSDSDLEVCDSDSDLDSGGCDSDLVSDSERVDTDTQHWFYQGAGAGGGVGVSVDIENAEMLSVQVVGSNTEGVPVALDTGQSSTDRGFLPLPYGYITAPIFIQPRNSTPLNSPAIAPWKQGWYWFIKPLYNS